MLSCRSVNNIDSSLWSLKLIGQYLDVAVFSKVKNFAKFVFSAGLLASSNSFQCVLLLLIKVFLQKWVVLKCSLNMGHVTNKFVAKAIFRLWS